jgi:hypothetical protein
MMRRYEQGVNQTPQTNALQPSKYNVRAFLKAGQTTSVAYSVYEIESFDTDKKHYVVVRPTEDSIPQAQLLIGPGHPVEAGKPFMATQTTDATTAAADTGQTVDVGDDIGTQKDSYKLKVDNTGFKALRYESAEGRCLVRPFSSGGGFSLTSFLNTTTLTVTATNVILGGTTLITDKVSIAGLPDITTGLSMSIAGACATTIDVTVSQNTSSGVRTTTAYLLFYDSADLYLGACVLPTTSWASQNFSIISGSRYVSQATIGTSPRSFFLSEFIVGNEGTPSKIAASFLVQRTGTDFTTSTLSVSSEVRLSYGLGQFIV